MNNNNVQLFTTDGFLIDDDTLLAEPEIRSQVLTLKSKESPKQTAVVPSTSTGSLVLPEGDFSCKLLSKYISCLSFDTERYL